MKNLLQPLINYCKLVLYLALLVSGIAPGFVNAQNSFTIMGKVVSATDAQPIPGVTILLKDTAVGTVTDMNGDYSLQVSQEGVLVFSFIGYQSREESINGRSIINVSLEDGAQSLDEVVVTGYTTQQKKDIIGAVSVVDTDAMKTIPTGSVAQALQGQASGVNVISSGSPGSRSNIFIRGVSSFGDSQPLVIIDGIQADLNDISSNDVASIQVLKDAGAAAIYGVRGSNGVIIVTTKKGKTGAPQFSYDTYYSMQMPLPGNPFDLVLNPEEFAQMALTADPNNALYRDGIPDFMYAGPGGSGIAMAGDPAVDPSKYIFDPLNPGNNYLIQQVNKSGTNWFQELFKPAPMAEQNLSVSGGTEKSKYMVSLGYLNQQGTLIETYLKRYSARINTSFNFGENFTIGQNLNLFYKENPGFSTQNQFGGIAEVYKMMPIVPTHDIQGNYGGTRAGINLGSNSNTVANQERAADNRNRSWNIVGNVFAELRFLKDFTARTSLATVVNNSYNNSFSFTQYENVQGFLNPNSFSESSSFSNRLMWTNTVNYAKDFKGHKFNMLVGTESITNTGRSVGGSRQNYYSTDVDYRTLSTGTSNILNYSNFYEDALFSLFSSNSA